MIHLHRYDLRAAHPKVERVLDFSQWGEDTSYDLAETTIAYVCTKCSKTKLDRIAGLWTLEELRGKAQ